jgi:glycosyltransferase involved in cell wall biosynthesis
MRILLVSQYFYPETFIINDLVKCLVAQGHTIELLTGKPNYPDGNIFPGYKARGRSNELFADSIVVHRVPICPRGEGVVRRIANYTSFVLSGLYYFHRLTKKKNFDVIFVFMPSPITSVIPALYLKKRFKLHLAVWVQDLWPETLRATGYVKNRFLLRVVGKLVRWIYAHTDTLLVQSEAFYKPISVYAAEEKIIYYPNSYLELENNANNTSQIPNDLLFELEHHFCLVFAGNLGSAQSLETIVSAAEQLKHLPECRLILVGSGSMSEWLTQQKTEKKLDNLILAGRFPQTMMPHIFFLAKGLLVTLKRDDIFAHIVPSKMQAYLAAGRPLIAALDGEGARIIDESGAGFTSPAEDTKALAKNIERLYDMSESERETLGVHGRTYFLKHFEMISQSKRLIDIFEDRIKKGSVVA